MAFAQWRPVRTKNKGVMSKRRGLTSQSLIDEDLSRRVGEMVFPSDDMGNMHQMVIDDTGKIIGRNAI
jgi:hypothetical protein